MAEVTPSGSGGPLRLSGPALDGGMQIRGGIGGITFQLEELVGGAEKLDLLADELTAVETVVQRIQNNLGPYRLDQAVAWTEAMSSLTRSCAGIRTVRTELQAISSQVRDSKRDYEAAEAVTGLFANMGIPSLADFEHVRLDDPLWPDLRGTDLVLRNVVKAKREILGIAEAAFPALKPRRIVVDRKESLPVDFDGSPAALLERARIVDARGPGYMEVIETVSDGQKAYVVVIPGTQAGGDIGGANPFDVAGIAEAVGHGSAEVNIAVRAALQDAGAERGAAVVAVGYSQGGIHAMNLAADPLFRSEYDMKYVLTAGSPVGGIDVPGDVSALHFEHRQDAVPGADGTANPDARNRVTVTLLDQVRTPDGEDVGLGPGHRLANYQEAARLASASDDPTLSHSTAVLAGVLGAGGTATATRYAMTRTPAEKLSAPGPRLQPAQAPSSPKSESDRQAATGRMQG
ncbi:hypothetical protein [Pseudarthrobacter sulfonivorans]|uniref:hypothetical protein n=1 Tax=Pseudarthrobacter sulfonivorans TaxID=121292 RepID=UPI00210705B4|nr:hypothetical protein [Pseudarthrobacter sulfonivorans]